MLWAGLRLWASNCPVDTPNTLNRNPRYPVVNIARRPFGEDTWRVLVGVSASLNGNRGPHLLAASTPPTKLKYGCLVPQDNFIVASLLVPWRSMYPCTVVSVLCHYKAHGPLEAVIMRTCNRLRFID